MSLENSGNTIKIIVKDFDLFYGSFQALIGVSLAVTQCKITALIGPSGCGKSTLLRSFNRMNDLIDGVTTRGSILIDNNDILLPSCDVVSLRKRVGMVFQRPNPFPLSIFSNIAFALRVHGIKNKTELDDRVKHSLQAVSLWDELKDTLHDSALALTLEQQQRLCIARLMVVLPEILLMDEPCSALDPVATARIEELMTELKKNYSIIIVTHNMQQAARISDYTGLMWLGKLVEFDHTEKIFVNPKEKLTQDYLMGRAG